MVFALDVALELGPIKVNFAQVSRAVPLGLIVEMRRSGMAALAPGSHGSGAHFVAKVDDRHEAVAARAIPLLRSRISAGAEGSQ
jgi:hypothetical protein